MGAKITVLGAGLVGKAIIEDLSKEYSVTGVDIHQEALDQLAANGHIRTIQADLSRGDNVAAVTEDADLVVGALPGFMGYNTVKNVIMAGKNMVDISFFPQDPLTLDEMAKEKGVTVVMDCGVAPGMSNIILGHHNASMEVGRFECLVGGLPFKREWPWQYKAVFSPVDVIEEYVRPARYVQNGHLVVREALSDPELVEFERIGTLEAWNSDGLRTLIQTMKIPNMIEKTLRYPGTIEYLRVLRESGFFSEQEVDLGGKRVRPLDLSARLLSDMWKLKPGEEDFTVMRVTIEGKEEGTRTRYVYNLFDRYDRATGTISMARTTGYTCTAAARLLASGSFSRKGLCPPETLGENQAHYLRIIAHLMERGVVYESNKTIL